MVQGVIGVVLVMVGVCVSVGDGVMLGVRVASGVGAVSYTHLTLPTKRIV